MTSLLVNIEFASPLTLVLILPLVVGWYLLRIRATIRPVTMKVSSLVAGDGSSSMLMARVIDIAKLLAFGSMVIALAGPRSSDDKVVVSSEGIDIMLVMDLSGSMRGRDFRPNRLEVSKKVASQFVDQREYDRIGLVLFGEASFTMCPLTVDHKIVLDHIETLRAGMLGNGTAIGMGLSTAVNRLKDSESKSRIVILQTDGENSAGYITPEIATEIAKEFGIKIYTIGIGSKRSRHGLDEELLLKISKETGGRYFRAQNEQMLRQVYETIDQLEKTEIETTVYKKYKQWFRPLVVFSICLLIGAYLFSMIINTFPDV